MFPRTLSAAVAAASLAAMTTQTVAGGYAQSCYEQVRSAPQYKTVYETVMVDRGSSYVEHVPAIYGTQKVRTVIRPEQVGYRHVPAEYSWTREHVLISPERTVARVVPGITKPVHRKVLVSDGGYTWEYQRINGRKVLCKVKRPPVYKTVTEYVTVSPERVVHERIPARYGVEKRRVLISPERKERYVIPAEYGWTHEKVLIRPAEKIVRQTPPRYDTVARQVMVSPGHSAWREVRISGHCRG